MEIEVLDESGVFVCKGCGIESVRSKDNFFSPDFCSSCLFSGNLGPDPEIATDDHPNDSVCDHCGREFVATIYSHTLNGVFCRSCYSEGWDHPCKLCGEPVEHNIYGRHEVCHSCVSKGRSILFPNGEPDGDYETSSGFGLSEYTGWP